MCVHLSAPPSRHASLPLSPAVSADFIAPPRGILGRPGLARRRAPLSKAIDPQAALRPGWRRLGPPPRLQPARRLASPSCFDPGELYGIWPWPLPWPASLCAAPSRVNADARRAGGVAALHCTALRCAAGSPRRLPPGPRARSLALCQFFFKNVFFSFLIHSSSFSESCAASGIRGTRARAGCGLGKEA